MSEIEARFVGDNNASALVVYRLLMTGRDLAANLSSEVALLDK